jgi:hypothetical protein
MENGGAASGRTIQPGNPERRESYNGNSAFSWMGQYEARPVEAFPTLRGPIVHEGFVPDEDMGMDLDNQAGYNAHWSAPASSNTIYQTRLTGGSGDYLSNRGSLQNLNGTPRFLGVEDRGEASVDPSSHEDDDDDDDDDSSVSEHDSE